MSHTKRIYNRKLKKAQRYYMDGPMFDESGYIRTDRCVGIPFTYRSWICMGNCQVHRDHDEDRRIIRKKRKEQFRFDLKNESKYQEENYEQEPEYDPYILCQHLRSTYDNTNKEGT